MIEDLPVGGDGPSELVVTCKSNEAQPKLRKLCLSYLL